MREKIADLEHEQWAHWTKYMLDNLTPENIARWRKQIDTPYAELSEKEKDSDRAWADKVLALQIEGKEAQDACDHTCPTYMDNEPICKGICEYFKPYRQATIGDLINEQAQ